MKNAEPPRRVAVIGGGLAGLSAAHRLRELNSERGLSCEITLFEAGPRLGGIIGSQWIEGYLVDLGADAFLTNKPGVVSLCRRLGIEDRLMPTDARYRGAFVLYDGRPVPVPEGFQLLSPTAIWPVITSPLFSAWGKARLLMEWFVPGRAALAVRQRITPSVNDLAVVDESVAEFTRRRFGREALERLIQPLVGGIYTSDPEKLSLAATMPRFLEMERDYGSLIRASLVSRFGKRNGRPQTAGADSSGGARYGLFAGFQGGMNDLVEALSKFVEANCLVRLNSPVTAVTQSPAGQAAIRTIYTLKLAGEMEETFDAVIVASTASQTAKLLESLDSEISQELCGIEYASSALVISGHRLSDINHPLNAFGLVIPQRERRRILAVSFSSRKFPNRAPDGRVLLRTFVGGALQPEMFVQSDELMTSSVFEELDSIFGVRGQPDFVRIYRYQQAMPQYHLGHLNRIARIEALTQKHEHLALTGIAYRGVGMPDVVADAERAAEDVFNSRS